MEGDSAGGSAKQGRSRKTQAILPLKGKILNVERARFDKMLSSAEVGTLITALGTGIGKDEYNPDKLRYHKIIIMTDADVDGSHIRTLLLTFFFRQTPELIERGHIYIAQPPLYKVKKGKQELYLKDDDALKSYLLSSTIDDNQLFLTKDTPPISGLALERLLSDYSQAQNTKNRLSQKYPISLINALTFVPKLQAEQLKDKLAVQAWADKLHAVLNDKAGELNPQVSLDVVSGETGETYLPKITIFVHQLPQYYTLDPLFVSSGEYDKLLRLSSTWNTILSDESFIRRHDKDYAVKDFDHLWEQVMAEARRGLAIQRYKGLGEMNADQLWETTMDPENRNMLKITIEDAIAADHLFNCLMGDEVEPRRAFIEENALNADIDT